MRNQNEQNKLNKRFEVGMKFHGHKCPAMPLGLRARIAAMEVLNVEWSQDKELQVISETGERHAAEHVEIPKGKGEFVAKLGAKCGEITFINKLKETEKGLLCIPCRGL